MQDALGILDCSPQKISNYSLVCPCIYSASAIHFITVPTENRSAQHYDVSVGLTLETTDSVYPIAEEVRPCNTDYVYLRGLIQEYAILHVSCNSHS